MIRVVHCKKEPYDVYIGRPSKWGNPYTHIKDKLTRADRVVETREEAVRMYEQFILSEPALMNSLHELRGKTLGCWCSPAPCHGDILLKLAN